MKFHPLSAVTFLSVSLTTQAFCSPSLQCRLENRKALGLEKYKERSSERAFFVTQKSLQRNLSHRRYATIEEGKEVSAQVKNSLSNEVSNEVVNKIRELSTESKNWGEAFGYSDTAETTFYGLFSGIRSGASMGLKGKPFYLKQKEVIDAMGGDVAPFSGYFTLDHLEQAVHDDFLDATRGSTDNRKGWQVRGHCFSSLFLLLRRYL